MTENPPNEDFHAFMVIDFVCVSYFEYGIAWLRYWYGRLHSVGMQRISQHYFLTYFDSFGNAIFLGVSKHTLL